MDEIKIKHNYNFPNNWWQWLFTGLGMIFLITPVFWIFHIFDFVCINYIFKSAEEKFFGELFYKNLYYFGIFLIILLVFVFIF